MLYKFLSTLLMLKGGYHLFQDFQHPEELKKQVVETSIYLCKSGKEVMKQIKAGVKEHTQAHNEDKDDEIAPKE